MQVLAHHIYEYKKGLRSLVLHTMKASDYNRVVDILQRRNIHFVIQKVNDHKINIFFGRPECVQIIESFGETTLNHLTDEQDFILGIMLGYDRNQQCERFLKRKEKEKMCSDFKSSNSIKEISIIAS